LDRHLEQYEALMRGRELMNSRRMTLDEATDNLTYRFAR